MAIFQVKTKNQSDIGKKPRVYFTCHPEDFQLYFKKVCEDIFLTHDCAIYYTEDMRAPIAEDEKEVDLGRNNLFVVPVTQRLLTTPNRAMDQDIPYARRVHIPVLPIMMEAGLDALYAKPDKFGELQYLNPHSNDATEISYAEKLKKYLESVLISDQLAQRVRAAFDAYIFLSYRKKDRKYANDLMRLIHSHPACRDIAIWFDEFLTPGESFRESIDKILRSCKLFALLVTPNLLEDHNYVMTEEYPAACRSGRTILPTEMLETDKVQLSAKYKDIPYCIKPEDACFHAHFLDAIAKTATSANNTPEHNFLIGLAYLDGIDVEVNRELALELITEAAEAGLPEAMDKLYTIYIDGIGANVDYPKALKWAQAKYDRLYAVYGDTNLDALKALNNMAFAYRALGQKQKVLEINQIVYTIASQRLGENNPVCLVYLSNLATAYSDLGEHRKALEMKEKTYALECRVLGEEHPSTLLTLSGLAVSYSALGERKKALELKEKVYALQCRVLGETHPDTLVSLSNLAYEHGELGYHHTALALKEKVYTLQCRVLGEAHPSTLISLNNLAITYGQLGEHQKAAMLQETAYELTSSVLGEDHPDMLDSLKNLAYAYEQLQNDSKLLEVREKEYALVRKLFGPEHMEVSLLQSKLISLYDKLGQLEKGAALKEIVYARRSKLWGEEDPQVLGFFHNLAQTYTKLGEYKKALAHQEKVYTLRCKVLGKEHPETLKSLHNLAYIYNSLKDHPKALQLQQEVYSLRYRLLGENDPATLLSLNNLACICRDSGDKKTALSLFEQLLSRQTAVHGAEHPETQKTLQRIKELRQAL